MSDPNKRSAEQKPAEQSKKSSTAEKTPKDAKKGTKGGDAKAEAAKAAAQKPPLPTIQPVGKPEAGKPTPTPGLPLAKSPQPPGTQSQRPNLPGSPQQPAQAFPQSRQPTGLFGSARPNARVTWEVLPTHDAVVRIDLSKLPIEIFKLLGIRPPDVAELEHDAAKANYWGSAISGVPSAVAQVISDHLDVSPETEKALKAQLDSAWGALGFVGAAMVFNWCEEAKVSFATRFQAVNLPAIALRATDPLLVLNILTRVRSGTLISNMPAALEKPFLERQIFMDDSRVIAWVKASGCAEELLVEPSPQEDLELPEA